MSLSRKQLIILIVITTLSFALRFLYLDSIPDGFHKDEASFGYNAFSILNTGKDEYGKKMPLIFEALGDYKLGFGVYSIIPSIILFGLNDFAVRATTAFFGSITPIIVYFLSKKLFKSSLIASLSAISIVFSPSHLLFSRSVFESTISVFLITSYVYFLISFLEKWNLKKLFLCVLFGFLSLITYRTQYVFLPLITVSLIWLFKDKIKSWNLERKITSGCAFAFLIIYLLYITFAFGNTRYKEVGLTSSFELQLHLNEQIREDGVQNPLITRSLHNKLLNIALTAATNYVSHFDLSYLFFTGDKHSSINSTPFQGYLLFVDLPVLLVGMLTLIFGIKNNKYYWIPLLWLFMSPIASAFTVDSPSAVRNLVSSVGYSMIIGLGLFRIYEFSKRPKYSYIPVFILFMYFLNIIYFGHQFVVHKNVHEPWYRNVGTKEMITYVKQVENDYEKIVFADYEKLYIFLLYYEKINPHTIVDSSVKFVNRDDDILSVINPLYIHMPGTCPTKGKLRVLYICTGDKVPYRAKIHRVVRLTDNQPAFIILEFNPIFDPKMLPQLPDRISFINELPSQKGELVATGSALYW